EAGFVEDVEARLRVLLIRRPGKVRLQRDGCDTSLRHLLRGPRGWRESADVVSVSFGGFTDGSQDGRLASPGYSLKGDHVVAVLQNLPERCPLRLTEVPVASDDFFFDCRFDH